jgi:hypothetical protein
VREELCTGADQDLTGLAVLIVSFQAQRSRTRIVNDFDALFGAGAGLGVGVGDGLLCDCGEGGLRRA